MSQTAEQLYAELYDLTVPDWPGEMDFYRELAQSAKAQNQSVLEAACGTGRVAIRLAEEGVRVVGTDLDAAMLEIARRKNAHVRWVRGDMRALDLGETFGLIILPGHSFQFMCTPEDQVAALETFIRHLEPGGTLAIHLDHQSVGWLGALLGDLGGKFEPGSDVRHPNTGHTLRRGVCLDIRTGCSNSYCSQQMGRNWRSWVRSAEMGTAADAPALCLSL